MFPSSPGANRGTQNILKWFPVSTVRGLAWLLVKERDLRPRLCSFACAERGGQSSTQDRREAWLKTNSQGAYSLMVPYRRTTEGEQRGDRHFSRGLDRAPHTPLRSVPDIPSFLFVSPEHWRAEIESPEHC
jgi:hypothetical protein